MKAVLSILLSAVVLSAQVPDKVRRHPYMQNYQVMYGSAFDPPSLHTSIMDWLGTRLDMAIPEAAPSSPPDPNMTWVTYTDFSLVPPNEVYDMQAALESAGYVLEDAFLHTIKDMKYAVTYNWWLNTDKFDYFEGALKGVFTYASSTYADKTADSYSGLSTITVSDTLYAGYMEPFDQMNFTITQARSGGTVSYQYWNGAWVTLTPAADTTSDLTTTGKVSWLPPADWVRCVVNGSKSKFWVRVVVAGASTPPIYSKLVGDKWYVSSGSNNARGWDTTSGSIINLGTRVEYNPTPPATASAKFRYQSRATGIWNVGYHRGNFHTTVDGVPTFAYWLDAKTKGQVNAAPTIIQGVMFDDYFQTPYVPGAASPTSTSRVSNIVYFGDATSVWTQVNITVTTARVGGSVAWEYWNGSAWTALTTTTEETSGLTVSGSVQFTDPGDWEKNEAIAGSDYYWVRAVITGASVLPVVTVAYRTWTDYPDYGDTERYTATTWIKNSLHSAYGANFRVGANTIYSDPGKHLDWLLVEGYGYPTYVGFDDFGANNPAGYIQYDDLLPENNPNGTKAYFTCYDAPVAFTPGLWHNTNWYAWDRGNRSPIVCLALHLIGANENTGLSYYSQGGFYYTESDSVYTYKAPTTLTADVAIDTSTASKDISLAAWPGCTFSDVTASSQAIRIGPQATGDIVTGTVSGTTFTTTGAIYNAHTSGDPVSCIHRSHQSQLGKPPEVVDVYKWSIWYPALLAPVGIPDTAGLSSGARIPSWKKGGSPDYVSGLAHATCDSSNACADIWRRDYTGAIVLWRPYMGTAATEAEIATPSGSIAMGGTYWPLQANGKTAAAVTSVTLKANEAAILMKRPIGNVFPMPGGVLK